MKGRADYLFIRVFSGSFQAWDTKSRRVMQTLVCQSEFSAHYWIEIHDSPSLEAEKQELVFWQFDIMAGLYGATRGRV